MRVTSHFSPFPSTATAPVPSASPSPTSTPIQTTNKVLQSVVIPAIEFKTQAANWLAAFVILLCLILFSTNTDYRFFSLKQESRTTILTVIATNNGVSNNLNSCFNPLKINSSQGHRFNETKEGDGEKPKINISTSDALKRESETESISLRILRGHPRQSKRSTSRLEGHHCTLEVFRPSKNETILIQISRTYSLLSPNFEVRINGQIADQRESLSEDKVRDEMVSMAELKHCIYTGETPSHPGGQVALSACQIGLDFEDFRGFTGLIALEDEHWFIEPEQQKQTAKLTSDYPHVMHRPRGQTNHQSPKRCTARRFQMPSDSFNPKVDSTIYYPYSTSSVGDNKAKATTKDKGPNTIRSDEKPRKPVKAGVATSPNSGDPKNQNPNQDKKFSMSSKTSDNKESQPILSAKTDGVVVELAIFADKALYDKMKKKFPNNTLKQFAQYLLAQVNNVRDEALTDCRLQMNLLYHDPSIGYGNSVDIRLNYLEILTKNVKSLNTGKGKESIYLTSFCNFAAKKNKKIGFDHAMMLTGLDLRDSQSNGVLGVAWTAAVCDKQYSCSMCEASDFVGTYTMTHELGHSLGMIHDGEEGNLYCSSTDHIMAALGGPGQTTWSICSQNNLRDFLNGRSKVPEASTSKCLKSLRKTSKKRRKPIAYKKKKLPGEMFSPNQQCGLFAGRKFNQPVMTGVYPYDNICRELMCGNGTISISSHPALEGTECGQGKWCKAGRCEYKPTTRG